MKNKQIDVLDIILVLAKHKKLIILGTLFVSVVAIIYSLVHPITWTSSSSFLPVSESSSNIDIGSSLLGLSTSFLGSNDTESDYYINIMYSRTFSEDIIRKFDLINEYELDYPDTLTQMHYAIIFLKENTVGIEVDNSTGMISVSVETDDKYLSTEIANYYINSIDNYNRTKRITKGKEQRQFLETRILEVEVTIDSIANSLRQYQEENNILSIDKQTSALIQSYSDFVSEKITVEIQKEYLESFYPQESPMIESMRQKNDILEKKISDFENTIPNNSKYILSLKSIPELSLNYQKMMLKLEIQKKVYEYIYPQYEAAKISEVKDLSTIEIIDIAIPAGQRTKPRRAMICIISFLIALIFFTVLSFILDRIEVILKDKFKKEKLNEVKHYISFKS